MTKIATYRLDWFGIKKQKQFYLFRYCEEQICFNSGTELVNLWTNSEYVKLRTMPKVLKVWSAPDVLKLRIISEPFYFYNLYKYFSSFQ